jgi:hypothetical protein
MRASLAALAVFALTMTGTALLGCKPKEPGVAAPSTTAAAVAPAAGPAMASKPARSLFIQPRDRASLRRYLETTPETAAKRFDVEWNPAVVRVDRAAAARTLQSVSADGSQFVFSVDDVAIAALKPGKIMLLWGIAVRRVTSVRKDGARVAVATSSVSLSEVFTRADIQIDYAMRPTAPLVVPHVQPPEAARRSARGESASGSLLLARYDAATDGPSSEPPSEGDTPGEGDHVLPLGLDSWGVSGYHGFDITAQYGPAGDGIAFSLEARLSQSDLMSSSAAKDAAGKLLEKGSELLDLRIGASGRLHATSQEDTLRVASNIVIKDSAIALLRTDFDNVNGDLQLFFIARRGPQSSQWLDKLKVELPIRFNIPVIVGGLPFMFQVAFNFLAQPALNTKNDAFTGTYHIPFSGSTVLTLENGKLTSSSTLQSIPEVVESLGSSIGVSAILIGIQAPRVGFGMGLFGSSSVAYIDLVNSFTITSGGQLGMFHCKHHQLVSAVNAGIDTEIAYPFEGWAKILGKPLSSTLEEVSKAASTRQQVFKKEWNRAEPQIISCELDKGEDQ